MQESTNENWRDIPDYEGLYQVSDCGRVKSFKSFTKRSDQKIRLAKEKILKLGLDSNGYPQVGLCKDGKTKYFLVHRLVVLTFLDGDHSLTVNHIDECPTNNHISNLEYLSIGDNVRAWNKNNFELFIKNSGGKKVLDTQTGKVFLSIRAASRYMYEEEGAKGPETWYGRIKKGTQNRFQILNN